MKIPDEVRREVVVEAPRERVWRAITEADQLLRWFPDKIAQIDLRPDGAIRFEWQDGGFDDGTVQVVEEPSRFVFRWHGRRIRLEGDIGGVHARGGRKAGRASSSSRVGSRSCARRSVSPPGTTTTEAGRRSSAS